jgi:hypothetical protein
MAEQTYGGSNNIDPSTNLEPPETQYKAQKIGNMPLTIVTDSHFILPFGIMILGIILLILLH